MAQLAAARSTRPDPLAELRLRFRNALRPGVATIVNAVPGEESEDDQRFDLAVRAEDVDLVTGSAHVRIG